ncbi:MAG: TolC family protein [Candidatus Sumerlaeia bacterium]
MSIAWRPFLLLSFATVGLAACAVGRVPGASDDAPSGRIPRIALSPAPAQPLPPQTEPENTATTAGLRLDDLVAEAMIHNPMLQAEYSRYLGQREQIAQARSLPDPMMKLKLMGVQRDAMKRDLEVMLSQMFPWFGKLRLMGEMADAESRAAKAQYQTALLDVMRDIKENYYKLEFEHAAWRLRSEEKNLLQQILYSLSAAYAGGQTGRQPLLKTQTELARVESELVTFPAKIRSIEAELNRLTGAPPGRPMPPPGELPRDVVRVPQDDLIRMASEHRPELERLRAMIEKAQAQIRLAKKDYFPDITLGVIYQTNVDRQEMVPEEDDMWSLELGFNIPIPNARRRAQIRQAHLAEQEFTERTEAVLLDIEAALRTVEIDLNNLYDQISLYENNLLPLADETLAISRQEYRAGKGSFLDVLDAERMLLNVRLEYLRLLRDYRLNLVRLERALGAEVIFESALPAEPSNTQ